jgi:hypothetical protein
LQKIEILSANKELKGEENWGNLLFTNQPKFLGMLKLVTGQKSGTNLKYGKILSSAKIA